MVLSESDRRFLDQPGYLRLATLMPDGAPQITVLWYRLTGDAFHVVCPQSAQKVLNLERDGRISGIVEDPATPHRFLELRGRGEVVRDDAFARGELREIAARYIGERAGPFVDGLSDAPRVVLRLTPRRVNRHGLD
jgi:PPOX class probable F420-dependent enzyme